MVSIRAGRRARRMLVACFLTACSGGPGEPRDSGAPKDSASPERVADSRATVVFVGTSLTAGYGLAPDESFPARIQEKIDSAGLHFVSSRASAARRRRAHCAASRGAGRGRSPCSAQTGANDGLRGQSIDSLRSNLRAARSRDRCPARATVLVLAGMEDLPISVAISVPVRAVYRRSPASPEVVFLPFLLTACGLGAVEQSMVCIQRPTAHSRWRRTCGALSAPS